MNQSLDPFLDVPGTVLTLVRSINSTYLVHLQDFSPVGLVSLV